MSFASRRGAANCGSNNNRQWGALVKHCLAGVVLPGVLAEFPDDFEKKRMLMMGGFGSGRRRGLGRDTVEACAPIDVSRLHRKGCLLAGWIGSWQWTCEGEKVASINLRAELDRLHLTYRVCVSVGDWEDVAETVRIVRVTCRFGGCRPYFRCPGVVDGIACERRVAKLYGAGRYFLCRRCYRLAYDSQGEGAWHRTLRRANKIRQRLGGDPGMAAPFPLKPIGMWWRTYERLRDRALEAEMRADETLVLEAERVLRRVDTPKPNRSG